MPLPTARLQDFVDINPRTSVPRGQACEFVEMADITPGRRYVVSSATRESGGSGSKFLRGDTLMARITPCLENGKIAQFKSASASTAIGSTEFWVLRAKPDVSDPAFVFYLAYSSILRDPAEKSMAGASGRQRADVDAIRDLPVPSPSVRDQRRIASVLSAYDDLIENNTRRIAILEEMARSTYEEWFVRFRFPGHENVRMVDSELGLVPEGWQARLLGDEIELAYGKALKAEDRVPGEVPVYGSSGVVGHHSTPLVSGPGIIVGRKGNVGSVHWCDVPFFPIDTVFYVKTLLPLHYVFFNLQRQNFLNNDAAVPGLNRNQAYALPLLVPSLEVLRSFEAQSAQLLGMARMLARKNVNLRETRDLLLPKLISGELDVSALPEPEAVAA